MIRLALLLLFLAGVGLASAWMAEHPGDVVIRWFDYRIDTSVAFLALLALLAAGLAIYLAMLASHVASAPRRFREYQRLKHHQRGLAELTFGVAALAAADDGAADRHARKAEKLLGTTPLGLLISAQVAKIRGDDANARLLLMQMLHHRETKHMATRMLNPPRTENRPAAGWRRTWHRIGRWLQLRG